MGDYLTQDAGKIREANAVVASAGAGSADALVKLDSGGRLDASVLPTGVGAETISITASEALTAGDFVNIFDAGGGTANVRRAAATGEALQAHGFVLSSVTSGNSAEVFLEGTNTSVTGQTPGDVFLSATTPGAATDTAPSTATQIVQNIGVATSATTISFEAGQTILLV